MSRPVNSDDDPRAPSAWTAADDAVLRRLAARRHAASEIGVRLGRSRAAVLGRAHRLGVRLHGASPLPDPAAAGRASAQKRAEARRLNPIHLPAARSAHA